MKHSTITRTFRKLAAGLAAALALGGLGSVGTAALTQGVAHADVRLNHVSKTGGLITWVGGSEYNHVTVSVAGGTYTITDSGHDVTASSPCVRTVYGQARCTNVPGATPITGVRLEAGASNDWLEAQAGYNILVGGAGSDILIGGSGNDDLQGGDGNDGLFGQAGNDKLDGGVGTTSAGVLTDAGDYISGGPGIDWATYIAKTDGGVTVTLDGLDNDGKTNANERDNVLPDVEDLTGTRFDDVLYGSNGENYLFGTWGSDALIGLGGNDSLYGEDGYDALSGGLGQDSLYGGADNDSLYQQFGTSTTADIDLVSDCGSGFDYLYRDSTEGLPTNCERVFLPTN